MHIEDIAKVAHQTNKAYIEVNGDHSQPNWEDCSDDRRNSTCKHVEFILRNPLVTPDELHRFYVETKLKEGWVWSSVYDGERKCDPILAHYSNLSIVSRVSILLFRQTAVTLLPLLD